MISNVPTFRSHTQTLRLFPKPQLCPTTFESLTLTGPIGFLHRTAQSVSLWPGLWLATPYILSDGLTICGIPANKSQAICSRAVDIQQLSAVGSACGLL